MLTACYVNLNGASEGTFDASCFAMNNHLLRMVEGAAENCNQFFAHLYFRPPITDAQSKRFGYTAMILRENVRSTPKDTRPVNLDIGTINLPVTAYASITHRVTGVLMFFASFFMLWALDMSLASEASFNDVVSILGSPTPRFISWCIASVLTYHALAGLKHLIMDAGVGETMQGGVIGARIVFALAMVGAVGWGSLIW